MVVRLPKGTPTRKADEKSAQRIPPDRRTLFQSRSNLTDSIAELYQDIYPYGFSQPMQLVAEKLCLIAPDEMYQRPLEVARG